jgi:hypothetical protein
MTKFPAGIVTILGQTEQSLNVLTAFVFLCTATDDLAAVTCAQAGTVHTIKHAAATTRLDILHIAELLIFIPHPGLCQNWLAA